METISEYPRPDFDRSHRWLSLNGVWDFAPDPEDRGHEEHWERQADSVWSERIRVPFAWETPLSGVERHWLPVGWYRRSIQRPAGWTGERIVLHIGAAHYLCQVWLNGRWIGEHNGGYLPFSLDLTDALDDGRGELVLRVEAPVDKRFIPHGKQRSRPADDYDGCCFTPSSGIWQPVWLEGRPATYIERLELRPTDDLTGIRVHVGIAGPRASEATLSLHVDGVETRTIAVQDAAADTTITIPHPVLWSPRQPHLYHIIAQLESADGEDRVSSYTGLRKIEIQGTQLLLNGERLFVRGVLDQGFWPGCGYTAPDDAALRRDVELALAAGYNLARKHIKFEDPRWLYWADRLGLLVWAEPPCASRYTPEAIARYEAQLAPWVARDGNHPSIVLWGLYNEEWGLDWRVGEDREKQQAVARAYDTLAALDHSRPIIDNSGWWHVKTDVLDWHYYDNDVRRWSAVTAALADDARTWFGHQLGPDRWYETQLSIEGSEHTGLPLLNGEYGGGATSRERGWHLRWQTQELRRHDALSGYIYTELTDIEHELCGIYSFDRHPRELDCDPATVNADTVILFDVIPVEPGHDVPDANGAVSLDVRVSHHGMEAITGTLQWSWGAAENAEGQLPVVVTPYHVTKPHTLTSCLPKGARAARLHVWITDTAGAQRASSFVDVSSVPANT